VWGQLALWVEQDCGCLITSAIRYVDGAQRLSSNERFSCLSLSTRNSECVLFCVSFPYSDASGFAVSILAAVDRNVATGLEFMLAGDFTLMSGSWCLNHVAVSGNWFFNVTVGSARCLQFFFEASPASDLRDVVRPRTTRC